MTIALLLCPPHTYTGGANSLSSLVNVPIRNLKLQVSKEWGQGVGFRMGLVAYSLVDHLSPCLPIPCSTAGPHHVTKRSHTNNIHFIPLFFPNLRERGGGAGVRRWLDRSSGMYKSCPFFVLLSHPRRGFCANHQAFLKVNEDLKKLVAGNPSTRESLFIMPF